MIKRFLASGGIGISLMILSIPQTALAQQTKTAAAKAPWTPPKTPWGEPDLQGMWPLNHLINTPFQRNEKYGNRRLMSDEGRIVPGETCEMRTELSRPA